MVYEVRCSYCGRFMCEKEAPDNNFTLELKAQGLPNISHGICQSCKEYVLQDIASCQHKGGDEDE